MQWFCWNGIYSHTLGVEVLKLPDIYTPAQRGTAYTVPGRNGTVWVPDGSLEELVLPAECYLPYEQGVEIAELTRIREWLSGEGWWMQSNLPGRRYRAQLRDSIDFVTVLEGFADRTFTLVLYAEPYQYFEPEPRKIILTAQPATFTGHGNYQAAPRVEIYGSGDVTLTINDQEIEFTGLTEGAVLDSELRACLLPDGKTDASGLVTGMDDFPMLAPGANSVSWEGSVERVVISPRWRDV